MNAVLFAIPLLLPLACALAGVLFRGSRPAEVAFALLGPFGLLGGAVWLLLEVLAGGIQVAHVGAWPPPYAITLVADLLSAAMLCITGVVGAATAVYALGSVDDERRRFGFFPLLNVLLMGVSGAFLTGDVFNLFVWFEVMLMASFVLIAHGGRRAQLEGAIKYVALNLVASALFLAAAGSLYGLTGALNMAHVAVVLQAVDSDEETLVAMLFLTAFSIKAAAFPLFFWLPASYHTPPTAVSAVFAGLLTKVGVYAMLRAFTIMFVDDVGRTHEVIVVIACLTMVTGVLGALAQTDVRRVLSFHIVSQIGYMLLGLGLYSRAAIAASILYVVHHILVKTNLFFIAGLMRRARGSLALGRIAGLYESHAWLGLLFLLSAFSLAGIPPLSGFFAKLAILRASFEDERFVVGGVALVVGLLTLMSMTKIWMQAFWRPEAEDERCVQPPIGRREGLLLVTPVAALTTLSLLVALFSGDVYELCLRAADQTFGRDAYVRAVLEGAGGAP